MKKLSVFFILLIVIPSTLADWFYNSQNIITNIQISSDADIVPTATNGYIESALINLTFFPKQTHNQELIRFYTGPEAEITDKTLKFSFEEPEDNINFRLDAVVKTTNTIPKIRQKIDFPIKELPDDVIKYTKQSETIDSDDEDIIRLASELVKGEDDLYSAVFKIADWTKNNIDYNLSTLTAEVSQKASWVLQNKQGVCDELTSLFIALLRAVGISARFVSGVAYTNSPLFPENWGPHGWAEVYFPSYGWVPFDVTYGEFGWTDPTHIKFKDSVDSNEPSTYYQWLGRNADLKTRKLDLKTNLIDKIGYVKPSIQLDANVLKKAINFGSYNLIEVTAENLNDFYYATEIYLNKPKEIKIIGNEVKSILLLPREKKKIFWTIKLEDNFDNRFSYTFPLVVSTLNNISSETSFIANIRESYVSFEEIQQVTKLIEEGKEKKYSGNVILDCEMEKNEFYEYEDIKVYCKAKNIGNVFLDNVYICFENKCDKIKLGISQTKNFAFKVNTSFSGHRETPVTLRNELVSKSSYVNFNINDIPKIQIEDLNFPVNVSFGTNFTISFTIAKKSQSNPKNVEVFFTQNGFGKKWNIPELSGNNKFDVVFEGSQLKYGKNNYQIAIYYNDKLNKQYKIDKEFSVELTNTTILQRLLLSLHLFKGIKHQEMTIMLLTGTIAFLLAILILFGRTRKNRY